MNKLEKIIPNLVQRDYSIGAPFIDKAARRDWVRFGYDNQYPQMCLDLANESPLQKAILENKVSYMFGAGLASVKDNIYTPNLTESWSELTLKVMTDFVYLGAFAIQVILNESGNKFSFYHQPIDQVRLGQYNEFNFIDKAYICTNWAKANKTTNVAEIKMWGSETPRKGERYLMYFKRHELGQYYYAIPQWMSAANYIACDAALAMYYNNYVRNNFSANLCLAYPSEPDEDKKAEIYRNLQASFGGSENAGNILLLFGENGILPTISSIESVNADLYNSVVDTVKLAIVSANRLTSPILAGISTSSGFSSKSDEIIAATVQYRLTVINSERQFVLDKLNDLLVMNGYPRVLSIQDYNLADEFAGTTEDNTDKLNEGADVKDTEEEVVDDKNAENNVDKNEVENE